ncbi:hypothetical protein HOY80DRAFT_988654 [Tuber brumale]|nr:hypothetical protein HOY80DRAFT_988654 [Tuber brumale]
MAIFPALSFFGCYLCNTVLVFFSYSCAPSVPLSRNKSLWIPVTEIFLFIDFISLNHRILLPLHRIMFYIYLYPFQRCDA